jgi:UDP-glucuronate decarboxylase
LVHGKRGQVYNIGNPSPEITIQDLASLIKEKTPTLSPIEVVKYPSDYPSTEPHRRCPNINKASSEVGYSPKISLADGVIKYYNWAKDNYFLNERDNTTAPTPST